MPSGDLTDVTLVFKRSMRPKVANRLTNGQAAPEQPFRCFDVKDDDEEKVAHCIMLVVSDSAKQS